MILDLVKFTIIIYHICLFNNFECVMCVANLGSTGTKRDHWFDGS